MSDPLPAGDFSGTGANAISVDNAGGRNGAYGPQFPQINVDLIRRVQYKETDASGIVHFSSFFGAQC